MTRPKTKMLMDGGDPQETLRVRERLGFVDGFVQAFNMIDAVFTTMMKFGKSVKGSWNRLKWQPSKGLIKVCVEPCGIRAQLFAPTGKG